MENLDNPAGRLHRLLTRACDAYAEEAQHQEYLWARILDVPLEEVRIHMGRVSLLVPAIEQALIVGGHDQELLAYGDCVENWLDAVWGQGARSGKVPNPGANYVEKGAMSTLRLLSITLGNQGSEGAVPTQEDRDGLRQQVLDLIDTVRGDTDLADPLRLIFLRRLHQMLEALDHFEMFGPDGVLEAAQSLYAFVQNSSGESGVFAKVRTVTRQALELFRLAPAAKAALDVARDMGALPPAL